MKREMRRKDRALSNDDALQILEKAEYGILSTADADGQPYGVPVNFAYSDGAVYFHCAKTGHKLDNIKDCAKVCFTVVDSVELLSSDFATKYESVIMFGTIDAAKDDEEKRLGLNALINKLSPDYIPEGKKYIEDALNNVEVLKMTVDSMTAKGRR